VIALTAFCGCSKADQFVIGHMTGTEDSTGASRSLAALLQSYRTHFPWRTLSMSAAIRDMLTGEIYLRQIQSRKAVFAGR
jgi:hypothetical protein